MKKQLLIVIGMMGLTAFSQTSFVTDFESLGVAPGTYSSTTTSGNGFQAGHAFFGAHYDSNFGFWSDGWSASAVHDSSTAGFGNANACAAYFGYGGSSTFAVGNTTGYLTLRLTDSLAGKTVSGMYVCNSTYAYKSMKYGDNFAKKFGDTTGTNCGCAQGTYPDWFKLTVKRYYAGVLQNDSVEFYLADYRFTNSAQDYLVNTWTWLNLSTLGNTDSLAFLLHSTDNGAFGMNTPAFFCIDNLTLLNATGIAVQTVDESVNIFPNPGAGEVEVVFTTKSEEFIEMIVNDISGREIMQQKVNTQNGLNKFRLDISQWTPGIYTLRLKDGDKITMKKIIRS